MKIAQKKDKGKYNCLGIVNQWEVSKLLGLNNVV